MARIRTVKPEIMDDPRTAKLSHEAWRLFVCCLMLADDQGSFRADVVWLASRVFWGQPADTEAALDELTAAGVLVRYESSGEPLARIANFLKHQRIDRPSPPQFPPPPEDSTRTRRGLDEDSLLDRKGEEGNGSEGSGSRACRDAAAHPVARTIGIGNPLAEVKRQLSEVRAECTGGVLVDADWRKLMPLVQELHAKGKAHESIAAFRAFHADTFWQARGHPVQAFVKGYSEHDAKAKSAGRPRITSNGDGAQEVAF